MKKALIIIMTAALALTSALVMDAAAGGKGGYGHKIDLEHKLYMKAMFLLMNRNKLDLSDAQVGQIKDIKVDAKKELIDRKAAIDKLKVDIMAEMYEEDMDDEKVKGLIEKKYDLKKQKALFLVDSCSRIRDVLDKEQREKAKKLWMRKYEECESKKGYKGKKKKRHMM